MSSSSTPNVQPPTNTTTINNATTPAPSVQPSPSQPTLPPSDAFDFLPLTYDLLARLLPTTSTLSSNVPSINTTNNNNNNNTSETNNNNSNKPSGHLESKDVGIEASRIRLKIQKARALVSGLPDISRSIGEHEAEIAELQQKVRRQREILGGIRNLQVVKEAASTTGDRSR